MDLCTIFAHKVKIGCTLDEKQMEMQTLNKKVDATREKDIYRVTVVGSVVNFLLLVFKFFAGIVGHSAAMLADAVHSLSDFITDIIVIVFVRISAKPEDEGHDYGHGKYETLATDILTNTGSFPSCRSSGCAPMTGAIIFSMFSSRLKISSKGLFIGACF